MTPRLFLILRYGVLQDGVGPLDTGVKGIGLGGQHRGNLGGRAVLQVGENAVHGIAVVTEDAEHRITAPELGGVLVFLQFVIQLGAFRVLYSSSSS